MVSRSTAGKCCSPGGFRETLELFTPGLPLAACSSCKPIRAAGQVCGLVAWAEMRRWQVVEELVVSTGLGVSVCSLHRATVMPKCSVRYAMLPPWLQLCQCQLQI